MPSFARSQTASMAILGMLVAACGGDERPAEIDPSPPSNPSTAAAPAATAATAEPLPAPPAGPAGTLARAFDALLSAPLCEDEICVDPFPLHAVERVDIAGERMVLSGVGGWVALYDAGAWQFLRAPDGVFVHDAAFAPDGTLFAVGDPNALLALEGDALVVRGRTARVGVRSVLTAVLPLAPDEIWVGSMFGRVASWNGERFSEAPSRGTPRTTITDLTRLADGAIVARGDLATSVLVDGAWRDATTRAQWIEVGNRNGCWDEAHIEEVLAEPSRRAARGRPYEGDLPSFVDRSVRAFVPGLDDQRAALFAALVDDPPAEIEAAATDGADWARVVRHGSGRQRVWARIAGRVHVLEGLEGRLADVAVSDQVVFIAGRGGVVVRATQAQIEDAATRTEVALDTHAPVADILAIDGNEAWVLISDGGIHRVRAGESSLLHASGRVLSAIDGDTHEVFAVGEDGAMLRFDGTTFVALPQATRADLNAVRPLGPGSAVAVGDAGTVVLIENGTGRVLPRPTHDAFEDVFVDGETLFMRTNRELYRWNEGFTRVPRMLIPNRSAALALATWRAVPRDGVVAPGPAPSVAIAFEPPEAAAPTRVWQRYLLSPQAPAGPETNTWALCRGDRRSELIHYETEFCCNPLGDQEDVMSPEYLDDCTRPEVECEPLWPNPALGYDGESRELLRIVPVTPPSRYDETPAHAWDGECVPARLEILAMETGVVREAGRLSCADPAATYRILGGLRRFVPWDALYGEEGENVLAVHRTADTDTLVLVSADLRSAQVLDTLERPRDAPRPAESWGVVAQRFVSPDGAWTHFVADLATGPVTWTVRQPPDFGARGRLACETLYVIDPDGTTNVRAEPSSRAEIVGTLSVTAAATVVERRGGWFRIARPEGWVYRDNVRCE